MLDYQRGVVQSAWQVQHPLAMAYTLDVSVVIPFADDEDVIGLAVRRLARHLRAYGVSFEIIAVDEDSGDNSHAVLALLRPGLSELRITSAPGRGRGIATGAQRARGRVLWLVDALAANSPLAPFGRAYRRIIRREVDLITVDHRYVVCHRTNTLAAIDGLRGSGATLHRRLAKRAEGRGLAVETLIIGGAARPRELGGWPLTRFLAGLPGRLGNNYLVERYRR